MLVNHHKSCFVSRWMHVATLGLKIFSRFTTAAFVAGLLLGVPIGYSLNLDKNFEQIIIDEESFQTSEDQFINHEKRKF